MNARKIGRLAAVVGFAVVSAVGAGGPPAKDVPAKVNFSEHALRLLDEGNQRFIAGKPTSPNTDIFRIADTGTNGQHPFAAIVTCADSRVAVERLFDRGIGDLFVVRVAGNICDPNEAGSVEYACEHLGTQLVVVMGHTKCGAVKAACSGAGGGEMSKNLASLLDNIGPAVTSVRAAHPELTGDELVDAVVRENVWQTIEDLFKGSATMREVVDRGSVKIVGAVYDVQTGRVEWMGQHPAQLGLMKGGETNTASGSSNEKSNESADKSERADKIEKVDKPEKSEKPKSVADKSGFVRPGAAAVPKKAAEEKDEPKPVTAHSEHP